MPGGGRMGVGSPFIGPVDRQIKGSFDPSNFGRQPLNPNNKGGFSLPPAIPPRTLGDYDEAGIPIPNDPRNNGALGFVDGEQTFNSFILNGPQDFPVDDWIYNQGTWQTNPGVQYSEADLEAQRPKFDYMGRPLDDGGQVQWDENGNPLDAINIQREAQGLPPLGGYNPSMSQGVDPQAHLMDTDGRGIPQGFSSQPPQPYLGGGRPALGSMPKGNLGAGNTSDSGQIQKTLRYISELGFDPLEVIQNPALMNMLFNQFMY